MNTAAYDAIIIGAGINGLTCAAYLARAGLRTLVVEARSVPGGGAITEEIAPGFRAPVLAHTAGPLRRDVIEELQLGASGLEFVTGPADTVVLGRDQPVALWHDMARTRESLRACSPRDGDAWPAYKQSLAALGRVIGSLFLTTAPSIDEIGGRELWGLLRTLNAFRRLERHDAYRLLRWGPMAVADLVAECFETETLRAGVAADGIFGTQLGPWSAGSGLVLLLRAANDSIGDPGARFVKGAAGAIATAVARAAERAGAQIRYESVVDRVLTHEERVTAVVLRDGSEAPARAVVSAIDPKHTFLRLCDPMDLAPEFLWRMRNYRSNGTVAKLNVALSAQPDFTGLARDALTGRVRICPDVDYLERAFDHSKYGRYSTEPYIELTIPTLLDETLAPKGAHVLSAYVQFAPYKLRSGSWDEEREALSRMALDTIERFAPGIRSLIVAQQLITPLDLERTYGFTGGHIFHGELALDQMLSMRPLLGWGQYRTPIRGLYQCGSGTHPGTGLTGGSGRNAAREIIRELRSERAGS